MAESVVGDDVYRESCSKKLEELAANILRRKRLYSLQAELEI